MFCQYSVWHILLRDGRYQQRFSKFSNTDHSWGCCYHRKQRCHHPYRSTTSLPCVWLNHLWNCAADYRNYLHGKPRERGYRQRHCSIGGYLHFWVQCKFIPFPKEIMYLKLPSKRAGLTNFTRAWSQPTPGFPVASCHPSYCDLTRLV